MNKRKWTRLSVLAVVLSIYLFTSMALGQYNVGETISQTTRDKVVSFCSNGSGSSTLGALLEPEQGVATRVVWLNFFESW